MPADLAASLPGYGAPIGWQPGSCLGRRGLACHPPTMIVWSAPPVYCRRCPGVRSHPNVVAGCTFRPRPATTPKKKPASIAAGGFSSCGWGLGVTRLTSAARCRCRRGI